MKKTKWIIGALALALGASAAVEGSLNRRIDAVVSSEDVGVGARDGITLSAGDVIVTRNGVSHLLQEELRLPGGAKVTPDGIVTQSDGTMVTMREGQLLTFQGRLQPVEQRRPTAGAGEASPRVRSRALGY